MSIKNKRPTSGGDSVTNLIEGLSRRAEAALSQRAGPSLEAFAALSPEAAQRVLHDLQVHQIELEMQNEELRRAHAALEASRSHYFNFYDLAPVGYCSVTEKGLIKDVNLTFGIKNLFNTDPPFSAAYDSNTGAGSSWEPRIADPRGRAFTFLATYKFF